MEPSAKEGRRGPVTKILFLEKENGREVMEELKSDQIRRFGRGYEKPGFRVFTHN